jgi:hypothetical protein
MTSIKKSILEIIIYIDTFHLAPISYSIYFIFFLTYNVVTFISKRDNIEDANIILYLLYHHRQSFKTFWCKIGKRLFLPINK